MDNTRRRGLVLGGGGITGIAWELGLVAGLAEAGVDLRSADIVVGTSAGSVVGAQLTSDAELEHLYERQLEPPSKEKVAAIDRRVTRGFVWALLRSRRDHAGFGARLGAMSLTAAAAGRLPTLEQRYAAIRDRLPSAQWPDRDLRVTVVDARSGEFRVLTAADGVPLERAVAASCAVPGVYPAVPLDGRLYIDGGVRSSANVDVAAGCDRVLCLAPMARSVPWMPSARSQLDALGVPTLLVTPDAAAVTAIGKNVLDPAARPGSARAGRAQAAALIEELGSFWG
ncbi:MAG: patatin-like phospholipase family protein [Jatrophihabitans sp.]